MGDRETAGRLEGRVAIITGAAGGIGSATARLFVEQGARVFLVDAEAAGLTALAGELGKDNAAFAVADVSDAKQTAETVRAAVERFGGIDIAVLNAAIEGAIEPIADYPIDLFDKVIAVNLRGVWLGLKFVIPEMERRGGGSIVVTSSIAGVRGRPGISPYVASKHAVVGLVRTVALEYADKGIRINSVNPSPIDTRMMRSLEQSTRPEDPAQAKRDYAAASPMRRYGSPEEVAKMMLFLASDDSSHSTGAVFMVDGGRSAR